VIPAARPLAQLLLDSAQRHGERDCVVVDDDRITYAGLADRATWYARALTGLGVGRGDRVGILMANCLDFVEVLFGASLLGAVPMLYNARFKAREVAHCTADAGVRVIFTNGLVDQHIDYVELLAKAGIGTSVAVEHIVFLGPEGHGHCVGPGRLAELADGVEEDAVLEQHRRTDVADTALMFYTSGTTAMPKGCPLDHVVLQHAGVVGGLDRLGLRGGDVMWAPLPMFHSAFTQPLTGVFHVGGTLVSTVHFDAGEALRQIAREGVTVAFPAFPTVTMQLLDHPDYTPGSFASVRTMLNVGPREELVAMQERMPQTSQITAYGLSECGGSVVMCDPDDPLDARTANSGRALPGNEIEIRDGQGRQLGAGERGEICVRGRGVFGGYHGDRAATEEAFDVDGWFRTGDLGEIDADGNLTFTGRLKDMLKVGGENVAAIEVEGFLSLHPAVKLAQVVGRPDAKYGEVPVAFVELAPDAEATSDDIIEFCRGEIASFKVPRAVHFVDAWPMGATKILKYELRARLAAMTGEKQTHA